MKSGPEKPESELCAFGACGLRPSRSLRLLSP